MKRIPACLILAAATLAWAAESRGGPLPGEELSSMKVNDNLRIASYKANPYEKLSARLPESQDNIGGTLPNDHLRISSHLPYSKANISGFLPYQHDKIGVLCEGKGRDEVSSMGVNPNTKLASFGIPYPPNISSQFPTPH